MKKLIILLMLIANCVSVFSASQMTNNGVIKIRKGDYRKIGLTETFKPEGYSRLATQADFGLEYYVCGTTEQYVLSLAYQYVFLAYPSILPIENVLHITTQNGNQINLNSIIVREAGTTCVGYYPITEEQLNEISSGVSTVCYEIIISDQGNFVNDQESFKGGKFSKNIRKFYQKIQKEKKSLENGSSPIKFRKNSDVVLLYYGYQYDPFLYSEFLKANDAKHTQELWDYYNENKERINSFFNTTVLYELKEKNEKRTAEVQRQNQATNAFFANVQSEFKRLEGERQQRLAVEKAKLEQERAKLEARWAEQRAQAKAKDEAKQKAEIDRLYGGSNSLVAQMEAEKAKSASRRMETSDLAQYQAMQMSDAVYSQATTNQALAQQRQFDTEQNQRIQASQQQVQQAQAQQSYFGSITNAVTATGVHVQIKINGNSVLAYSTSNSNMGGVQWNSVSNVSVSTTSSLYESNAVTSRYEYAADIPGIGRVYWGPKQNGFATQSQVSGTAISAIDKNGRTLMILVNKGEVKGYSLGKLNASSAEYQWTYSHMTINIMPTDHTDGEFTQRFKNKANIPEYGTVYF